jgi:adenylate cyclase
MPGPELQANAISTVLRGLPLSDAPWAAGLAVILALALVGPLAATRFSFRTIAALALVLLLVLAGSAVLLFNAGVIAPFVAPALALGLGVVGALALKFALEARERRRTRELFERFVPRSVVGELLGQAGADRRLAGVRRDSTVLFVDLRGFTPFAEALEAEGVLEVLNRHLTEMSEAVLDNGGTVVSYMGDGLMAVFGSPVDCPDHAGRALAAGREMLEVRLPRLNAWLGEQGLPGFALGVGLNSGPVMSGTVGSERRLEYAAVGDTTNVAARLESMT